MTGRKTNIPYDRSYGKRLSVREAAEYLSCSESWVRQLISTGQLQAIRIGSRKGLRVLAASARDYLRGKEAGL